MNRRGFLARLTAAAAGMAAAARSGGLVVAAPAPAPAVKAAAALPSASVVPASQTPLARALGPAQAQLIEILRECCVTEIQQEHAVGELVRWRITYRQVKGRGLNEPGLPLWMTGLTHEQILDTAYPVGIEVRMMEAPTLIDVSHLNETLFLGRHDPVVEATVTWILPNNGR